MLQNMRRNQYILDYFNKGRADADKKMILSEAEVIHYIITRFYIALSNSKNIEGQQFDQKLLRYFKRKKYFDKLKGGRKKWKA